jgi:hypothetical protein
MSAPSSTSVTRAPPATCAPPVLNASSTSTAGSSLSDDDSLV